MHVKSTRIYTTSQRLREIMKERKLRQVDILNLAAPVCLEHNVKLGKNDLSQYVNGKVEPGQEKLFILGAALDVSEAWLMGYDVPMNRKTVDIKKEDDILPAEAVTLNLAKYRPIPVLGRIAAGLPLYAEQNVEGYTMTNLNGGAEYFALRVSGDSMNAIGINEGYLIIVRRQEEVENGEVAVVMVGESDATVKRFYSTDTTVTLMPQSTNPAHTPQIYDIRKTAIKVLGKVVKVEFML